MVGLCVDVLWVVVWLSVRTVGTVCKVEGDVQIVNNFHVCLYVCMYVKFMTLEASCYVFPYSFSLWSGCVLENGKSVVSIQTMGSYDGAEVCELVGLFILNDLCNEYGKDNIGLYRDDGLAIFKHTGNTRTAPNSLNTSGNYVTIIKTSTSNGL